MTARFLPSPTMDDMERVAQQTMRVGMNIMAMEVVNRWLDETRTPVGGLLRLLELIEEDTAAAVKELERLSG